MLLFSGFFVTCQACQDRLIDQVTGEALPDTDEAAAHLHNCLECKKTLQELSTAYHAMAFSVAPTAVPADLKRQLMNRVGNTVGTQSLTLRTAPAPRASEHWVARGFRLFVTSAVAAGVAVILTHAVMIGHVRDLQRQNEGLHEMLDFSQQQNVAMQEDVKKGGSALRVVQAADLRYVNLAGQPMQSGGVARLFIDPKSSQGYLVVNNARPAPAGKTYELWFIDASQKKIASGTFDVSGDGTARIPVKFDRDSVRGATVAAVTDEPAGGVVQPTGSIQFVGKVPEGL